MSRRTGCGNACKFLRVSPSHTTRRGISICSSSSYNKSLIRMHSSSPMDLQAMLSRLFYTVDPNFLDHRAQICFFKSTAACGSSHSRLKSFPISNNRCLCSSLSRTACSVRHCFASQFRFEWLCLFELHGRWEWWLCCPCWSGPASGMQIEGI
jgi:hypothetical protein